MHFPRLLPAFLLTGLLLTGCGSNKGSDAPRPDPYGSFDRRGMLRHLATNVIIPAFADFAVKADSLMLLTAAFDRAPTAATLADVQQQWRRTAGAYKRAEAYQFGPVKSQLLAPNIDFWPTRPENIERVISSSSTVFSDALVEQQGASVKGLAALEYLLFSRAGGPATELARLRTAADAGPRRAYLVALTQNLRTQAHRARNAWQNDYAAAYATNDAAGLNGSVNLTVNQLIAHLEYVRMTKVGLPAGKKDGTMRPTQVEAYASANSLAHLLNNLTGLERLYSGTTAAGINGPGFDDFLNHLNHLNAQTSGQPLAARITAQLADCRTKAQALSPSLSEAIATNPAAVDSLYDSLKQLLILVKVDMASSLSVTLTLNDNDGD